MLDMGEVKGISNFRKKMEEWKNGGTCTIGYFFEFIVAKGFTPTEAS